MLDISHDPFLSRRQLCSRCQRAQSGCICHWISPIDHNLDILILQHPMETSNAKNSARLLHLSLPHSHLAIGEVFEKDELDALLFAPSSLPSASDDNATVQPVLLYTEDASMPAVSRFNPRTWQVDDQAPLNRMRLVILDGTWRKSRKMLFENPQLQALPRLALRDTPTSQYTIRKAHKPEQLSTLEASGYALMQLEKNSEKYTPLLTAFDGFVLQQGMQRARGMATRRND